jgi:alpha-tubulin suppressor-like RCC1 family protein
MRISSAQRRAISAVALAATLAGLMFLAAPPAPASAVVIKTVSAGTYFTCTLDGLSTASCMGDNGDGQATPPTASMNSLDSSTFHSCGVLTDDTLTCWGRDRHGEGTPPAGTYRSVDVGIGSTSCAIRASDNGVDCWGLEIGKGRTITPTAPVGEFTQISIGRNWACGLLIDSTLSCWGFTEPASTPPTGTFSNVSSGFFDTCGVRTDGTIACWGFDSTGVVSGTPAATATSVSLGSSSACAVLTDGTLSCWGASTYAPAGEFESVSVGGTTMCGIRTDGTGVCWGENNYDNAAVRVLTTTFAFTVGQAANDALQTTWISPSPVWAITSGTLPDGLSLSAAGVFTGTATAEATETVTVTSSGVIPIVAAITVSIIAPSATGTAVSTGDLFSCAIVTDTSLSCWGDDTNGSATPPSGSFTAVDAKAANACAIRTSGALACWGTNTDGQAAPPTGTYTAVGMGVKHACALNTAGTAVCWGDDTYGQASPPAGTFTQIGAGSVFSCGIASDESLVCWGAGSAAPVGAFTALSVGKDHSCAIRTDETLACWGSNYYYQVSDAPAGSFIAVTAGALHSCAVRTSLTPVCWGYPPMATAPSTASDLYSSIDGGGNHTCGVRVTGDVYCFGSNALGQSFTTVQTTNVSSASCAQLSAAIVHSHLSPEPAWSVSSGTLPDGVSLTQAGVFSGTPITEGSGTVVATAETAVPLSATISVDVGATVAVGISVRMLPSSVVTGSTSRALVSGLDAGGFAQCDYSPLATISSDGARDSITGATVRAGNVGARTITASAEGFTATTSLSVVAAPAVAPGLSPIGSAESPTSGDDTSRAIEEPVTDEPGTDEPGTEEPGPVVDDTEDTTVVASPENSADGWPFWLILVLIVVGLMILVGLFVFLRGRLIRVG